MCIEYSHGPEINQARIDSQKCFLEKDNLLPQITKHKARKELSFFNYSDSKRYYSEPDVVNYENDSKLQYDLILGTETMKELGVLMDFPKTIPIDEITLPMRNINFLHEGASTPRRALKLNHSLATELKAHRVLPNV